MPARLPHGWIRTKLGEICLPVPTLQPENEPDAQFTYFDIGGVDNETNRITETKTVTGRSAPSRARQAVATGDILFSTVRTYLRKIARIERDYPRPVGSTGFTVIRPAPGVSGDFVFQQVLSEPFLQPLHALQTGSSYPAVRDRDVFAQPVVLPPTAEQERIVTKMDAILSRVGAGEAAAQRALARLKRYRAAVLHAAVTGELTRDWRKAHPKPEETGQALLHRLLATRRTRWEETELARLTKAGKKPKDSKWKARYPEPTEPETAELPSLPRGWTWASVDQLIVEPVKNGLSIKGSDEPPGIPALRLDAMSESGFDFSKIRYLPRKEAQVADLWILPRDFFVSRGNGSLRLVGRGTLAATSSARAIFPDTMIRLRFANDGALTEFISRIWASRFLRKQIEGAAKTTAGIYKISQANLVQFALPLPPLAEQEEIVRQVEHRLALADRLTHSLETALARVRLWRQSVLQAAFAGRLAPQSPDDEPASELLKRIRTARAALAAQPKPKRGRGGRKTKMKHTRRPILEVLQEAKSPMKPEDVFAAAGFEEATVEAFFAELKELNAGKKIREKRDPHERGLVLLEARA